MTLLATIFALFATAPGLGILLAIVSMPPLVRTMLVVQRRQELGLKVNSEVKIWLYIASLGVTIILSAVTLFIGLFTFCGIFFIASTETGALEGLITVAVGVALLVLAIWFFTVWIQRRWRRDISQP